MSSAVTTIANPERAELDAALSALSQQEQTFVLEFIASGSAKAASEIAGYAAGHVSRLRRRASIQRAVKASLRLREASAETSHESACQLLEAALHVRVSDLLIYDESGEVALGLRDRSTLSAAEELRIIRYESKAHRSAKGKRGGARYTILGLVSPLEILDRLATLRGWTSDSPQFSVLLQSISAPATVERSGASASLALVHDLAAELLQGERLDSYLIAHANGNTAMMAALLREGAAELRAAALAIPVEASL